MANLKFLLIMVDLLLGASFLSQTSSYCAHHSPLTLMGLKWANLWGPPGPLCALLCCAGIAGSVWQGFLKWMQHRTAASWCQGLDWALMSYCGQWNENFLSCVINLSLSSPLHVHLVYIFIFPPLLKHIWCGSMVLLWWPTVTAVILCMGAPCANDGHFPRRNGLIAKISLKLNQQVTCKLRKKYILISSN